MTAAASPFSVIILAGGFGRRLGRDKAGVAAGGRTLLHWSLLAAAAVSADLVVARRPDQAFSQLPEAPELQWREAVDERRDRGPLAGLEAALPLIRHDAAVAVACDMPLLRPALLRAVAAACLDGDGVDIAMPVLDGVAQPLLAAYRPSVAPHATRLLNDGDGRLRALLPLLPHRLLAEEELRQHDPELASFTNINRPDDLARVEPLLRQREAAPALEGTA